MVNYLPNIVLMFFFTLLSILMAILAPSALAPKNSDQSVGAKRQSGLLAMAKIFRHTRISVFALVCFIYGLIYGQACVLSIVFFKNLGASQLSIYLAVTSFIVTLFISSFFSGFFVKKFGAELVLCVALLILGLRAIFLAHVENSWLSLVSEPMLAISYAIFTTNVVTFVKKHALPGTEASAQSFMNMLDEGIGKFKCLTLVTENNKKFFSILTKLK